MANRVRARNDVADFTDDPCPNFSGRTARQVYGEQKVRLAAIIRRIRASEIILVEDRNDASGLLHNLAGTAVYFDDAELGDLALQLENPVRHGAGAATLSSRFERLLALLDGA